MSKRAAEDVSSRDPRFRRFHTGHAFSPPVHARTLNWDSLKQFEGDFPTFQIPKYLGSYSLDANREYHPDLSQLRYLSLPEHIPGSRDGTWRVNFDLRKGANTVITKDEDAVRARMLDDILLWILQEREAKNWSVVNMQNPLRPLELEFVCFRGLLTLIMASPYENAEAWDIATAKLGNTIYLFNVKKEANRPKNPRMEEMCVWGYKFEQFLCTSDPDSTPDTDAQLNTNAEFCCILKTRLAGHALLYGAEVDALRKDGVNPPWKPNGKTPTLAGFVELKTNRHIETERAEINFYRYKLLKWWIQSFLVGIPTVICGFRNDDGVVSELEEFPLDKMRKLGESYWLPRVCMNFCKQFLEFVANSFLKDQPADPKTHMIFSFDPRKRTVSTYKVAVGEISRDLLPAWYLEAMSKPVA